MPEDNAVAEAPAVPNPVVPDTLDLDFSKNTFNEALEAEKAKAESQPEPETPPPTPPPEPEPPGTTDDAKTEPPPATEVPPVSDKPVLPEELITGKKAEPESELNEDLAKLDAMVVHKGTRPEQVAKFSALKEEAKKAILKRDALIESLKSKTSEVAPRAEVEAASERVKAAETKAQELESTIERLAYTESPKFKRFLADESATLSGAKAYFEGTEINPEIIELAARTQGPQRIKVLREAGADAELIAAVTPYLRDFDNIQRYKTGALENWKVESAQYAEQVRVQQEAELAQRRKAEDEVWSMSVSELKNLVPYRKFEKNDSWNKRAEELLTQAKAVYNGEGIDLKQVAKDIIKGKAYDALDEVRIAITEELNKVREENARLKSAKPGASNGQASIGASNDASLSPEEQAKRRFNQELAKVRGQ